MVLLLKLPSSVAWTYLLLHGSRCNFLVALQALLAEACVWWANWFRDLQGEYFNLVLISSSFSSFSTAFYLVYFLPQEGPVEHIPFTTWLLNIKSWWHSSMKRKVVKPVCYRLLLVSLKPCFDFILLQSKSLSFVNFQMHQVSII